MVFVYGLVRERNIESGNCLTSRLFFTGDFFGKTSDFDSRKRQFSLLSSSPQAIFWDLESLNSDFLLSVPLHYSSLEERIFFFLDHSTFLRCVFFDHSSCSMSTHIGRKKVAYSSNNSSGQKKTCAHSSNRSTGCFWTPRFRDFRDFSGN